MLDNKQKYGDRVCLLTFEDLIGKTESVVRFLSDFIGIDFDDILLTPTFNKFPIKANTSFKAKQHGIIGTTLDRYKTLGKEELSIIDDTTGKIYGEVLKQTISFS